MFAPKSAVIAYHQYDFLDNAQNDFNHKNDFKHFQSS